MVMISTWEKSMGKTWRKRGENVVKHVGKRWKKHRKNHGKKVENKMEKRHGMYEHWEAAGC